MILTYILLSNLDFLQAKAVPLREICYNESLFKQGYNMRNVFLDIETIPTQVEEHKEFVQNRHDAKKKTARSKQDDQVYHETGLSGSFGEIVSIAWAIDDQPVQALYRTSIEQGTERALLHKFAHALKGQINHHTKTENRVLYQPKLWIGHRIKDFDLRFLQQRFIVNKLDPQIDFYLDKKDGIFDTMQAWAGYRSNAMVSLAELCQALGVPVKTNGLDGSKVWEAVLAGEFEKIAEYNCEDVEATRAVFNALTFRNAVAFDNSHLFDDDIQMMVRGGHITHDNTQNDLDNSFAL